MMRIMDAGLAAIIGAIAGGTFATAGTLGAAFLTGRFQGRNHHQQWQRDGRRTSYSALIRHTTAYQRALDNAVLTAGVESPDLAALTAQVEALVASSAELLAAASLVVVEGPLEAAAGAANITDCVESLMWDMPSISLENTNEASFETGGSWEPVIDVKIRLNKSLTEFTTAAQKALEE